MLEMKGVDYELVHVLPGNQRLHLRMAGFRQGTVPAMKLDGRRIQGSTNIARELEVINPDPPLYPHDPDRRAQVEEVERWGDRELQGIPRRIFSWAMTKDAGLRRWLAEVDGAMPMPGVTARVSGPVSLYYARAVGAKGDQVREDVARIPSVLDRIDELYDEKVLSRDPDAATLQVLSSVRALLGMSDFVDQVGARSYAGQARELFPHFPPELMPPFAERLGLTR
jgi:glutathione S-transferase